MQRRSKKSSHGTNPRKRRSLKLCSVDFSSPNSITIPAYLMSEANNTDHWIKKRKRKKELQRAIQYIWRLSSISNIKIPVLIKFTRIAPRSLDYDNLVISFKAARDTVADILIPGLAPGRADDSDQIEFEYSQEKHSSYGLRIDAREL